MFKDANFFLNSNKIELLRQKIEDKEEELLQLKEELLTELKKKRRRGHLLFY